MLRLHFVLLVSVACLVVSQAQNSTTDVPSTTVTDMFNAPDFQTNSGISTSTAENSSPTATETSTASSESSTASAGNTPTASTENSNSTGTSTEPVNPTTTKPSSATTLGVSMASLALLAIAVMS